MIEFDIPLAWLLGLLLIFIRVAVIIFFFPLFGDQFMPRTAKALLSLAVALAVAPGVEMEALRFPTTIASAVLYLLPELALGLSIGLSARLILEGIRSAGQFAGMQMGFMMANVVDPTNQSQISVVAQLWQISAIMIFFGIDGHHVLIQAIAQSLQTIPPFHLQITPGLFHIVHKLAVEMFVVTVQISAPVVAAMILTNVCLGLANKVVPQMHVFMESFPLRLLLGLWMMFSLMGIFVIMFERIIGGLGEAFQAVMRAMAI